MIETDRRTDPTTAVSTIERLVLVDPLEPTRRVGVRVERPLAPATAGPAAYVVLCHGFKGFMDWGFFPGLSRALAEAGFIAVSMNSSGSGIGADPLVMDDEEAFFRDTYSRQLEDIARVRDYARRLSGVDPAREHLFGHSRGGGMMLVSAAESAPRSIAVWAAIDDADRFDEAAKSEWRRTGVLAVPNGRTGQIHRMSIAALEDCEAHRGRLDIVDAARRLAVPLLALHGALDTTVDPGAATRLAGVASAGRAIVLEGADHAFGARHPMGDVRSVPSLAQAIDLTLDFFGGGATAP